MLTTINMKKINTVSMSNIAGGGWKNGVDYVCGGVDAADLTVLALARLGARVALGPIGAGLGVACAAWGIGRTFDWI